MELFFAWLVVVWILSAVAAGRATDLKGHGAMTGAAYSIVLGPVMGLLYAAALPDVHREANDAARRKRLAEPVPDPVAPGVSADPRTRKARCSSGCETFPRPGERCPKCGTRAAE